MLESRGGSGLSRDKGHKTKHKNERRGGGCNAMYGSRERSRVAR